MGRKEFHRFDKLKLHIMTHGNIKPFKCTVCDVGFTRKEHLKVHVNKQHSPTEIAAAKAAGPAAVVKEPSAGVSTTIDLNDIALPLNS